MLWHSVGVYVLLIYVGCLKLHLFRPFAFLLQVTSKVFPTTTMPAPTFRVDPQTVLHVDPQAGPMQGRPQWWDEAWKCQACLQATDRALAAERELASLKSTVQLERHQREKLNVLVPEIIAQRNEKSNEEAKQEKMRVRIEILESDQTREHKAFEAYKHASQAELDALKLKLKPRTPFEEAIAVLPEHLLLPFEGPVIGNVSHNHAHPLWDLQRLSYVAMLGEWREAESCKNYLSALVSLADYIVI